MKKYFTALLIVLVVISSQLTAHSNNRLIAHKNQEGYVDGTVGKQNGINKCTAAIDVQVGAISPKGTMLSCQSYTNITVYVEIENVGQSPIFDIPVSYSYDGASAVSEICPDTVAPLSSKTYSFITKVNLGFLGYHSLMVWSALAGDLNQNNDSTNAAISFLSGISGTVPFIEDFETFGLCSTASDCEVTVCGLLNEWMNEESGVIDDIDFRTNAGATPSTSTGPTNDHTTGTNIGKYMYLEPSGACTLKTALLTTPCLDLTLLTTPQLTFWYHMYGADMGELHIDIYSGDKWTLDAIPPIIGDQGNNWYKKVVSLSTFATNVVNIRFRGITGVDYRSDIAIDDVSIDNTTGLNENEFGGNVMVYPNPSNGIFNIVMNDIKNETLSIQLYNVEGKLLQQNNVEVSNSYKTILDMRNYSKGIYFLMIRSNSGVKRFKLTVI